MDQLEEQVSDLRSFLGSAAAPQAPEVVSPHDVGYSPGPLRASSHHSSLSAPGDNSAPQPPSPLDPRPGTAKRRAEDGDADSPAKQQRSKRNRYISIACNECKRRKIKCNGQTPCQRCGHLNLQCLYAPNCCSNFKDSDEFKQVTDQVSQLQDHVNTLFTTVNSLRQETLRLAPLHDRVLPPPSSTVAPSPAPSSVRPSIARPQLPFRVPSSFHGPTSIAYTVDMAKSTLHNMGYSAVGDGSEDGGPPPEPTPHASPTMNPSAPHTLSQGMSDPIWEFDEAEMLRLCKLYEEELGLMYPVIGIPPVVEHAKYVAGWMDAVRRNGLVPPDAQDTVLSDLRTLAVKLVLCCALTVEEHGNSARAGRLYDSIQPIADKMLMSEPADVTKLPILALVAGYRYLSNDEVLGWRVIGQVARLCFELGLHRREGLQKITDHQTRQDALHTFWASYVLDRRWSFSSGLPFVCHDDKIDPKLPYPEGSFLAAMIGYSKLGAKIWRLVDYFEPAVIRELKSHDFEELDREIMDWYDTIPDEIKINSVDSYEMPVRSSPTYDLARLQIWTRLRLNQLRIWLFTPVLHSATSIAEHAHLARRGVNLAAETIRGLAQLNNTTDLYRRCQVFYHQFLTSSIAVLFLASTHAPLQFSAMCRDEFYTALELVKEMSARSWVSHRLWRTIRSLRAYAPQLGLGVDSSHARATTGPHFPRAGGGSAGPSPGPSLIGQFNGVPSRAGSRGPVVPSPPALGPTSQQLQQMTEDQSNGLRLQTEMTRIFEGYTGLNGAHRVMEHTARPTADMGYGSGLGVVGPDGLAGLGNEDIYQHMKDMF